MKVISIFAEEMRVLFFHGKFAQAEEAILEHLNSTGSPIWLMNLYIVQFAAKKSDEAKKTLNHIMKVCPHALFSMADETIINVNKPPYKGITQKDIDDITNALDLGG